MTTTIIITFCTILLIAYVFDLTSSKTRIPSVILLLLLGWVLRQLTLFMDIQLPDLNSVLPVIGTIGLIMIVLEGSLELELDRSKVRLIKNSLFGALFSIFASTFIIAYLFYYFGQYTFQNSLINAIPFGIISSAIAIPSATNLKASDKEFVIYESSMSDIFGIVFFNFIALNEFFGVNTFATFGLQFLIILVISFVATYGLSFLLSRIDHHIKFVPIMLLVILIYSIEKIYHLPALIFIVLFGLFIGNLDKLTRFKWIAKIRPGELHKEGIKFREITSEGAFLVRSLFFLLFGYLIETTELLNVGTLEWALGIVAIIFVLRIIQLKLTRLPLRPLLFVLPRGLITILLFLSIEPAQRILLVDKSLIIQVIVLTALLMMFGLMAVPKKEKLKETIIPEALPAEAKI